MTSKTSIDKLAVFLSAFIIVSFAQLNLKAVFGWSPELIMAMLIVAGFFLNILEMTALSVFGIFLLGWRPLPGWEIVLFFALPFFATLAARSVFPWKSMINGVLGAVLSATIFYTLADRGAIISAPVIFTEILALTAVSAAVLFMIFDYFYKTHSA